ncbi:MAG: acyl-[ACP]--phospholipid O-acyltransferase [Beijerinckiaceae bacterium]|jgi:acyl-[acyl-carrier-protein]-phospholipid O-acyltransferase/long-chain-fatty-acid--[acyl-carrier-protein] ligase
MSSHLLRSRTFAPLFWCQALSAFNDTYLKTALTFLVIATLPENQAGLLVQLALAVFMAPTFIFSALGGEWADRYDKALMARRLKLGEFAAVGIAVIGFLLPSLPLLFLALFCFGLISALFGPIKYGILPDLLATHDIPAGNAFVEGATFIAVIGGTFMGGMASREGGGAAWFCALLVLFSAACWISSLLIPRTGEAAPGLRIEPNVLLSTKHLLKDLWSNTRLWRGGIIVSMFWLVGAVVMALLPGLVRNTLGVDNTVFNIYLALFAAGIGLGSALASWLLDGRIMLLPTPLAAVMLGLISIDLGLTLLGATPHAPAMGAYDFFRTGQAWHVGLDLLAITICGGLFVVPAFAAVQIWAEPGHRARIIAAVNVLSAAFMVAGAVAVGLLQAAGLSNGGIFILIGVVSVGASAWIFAVLPANPLQDLAALMFRLVYSLDVRGHENIAKAGPNAVIVMNHTSFLDAAALFSVLDNEAVFAVDTFIAERWWLKPLLKFADTIPVDPTNPLAIRALIHAAQAGKTLVIFPEGRLTRTGSLMKIYDGAGLIAVHAGLPVVSIRIQGTEPTHFSVLTDAQVRRRWFNKITITILEPRELKLPDNLRGRALRQAADSALYEIMSETVFRTTPIDRTLFEAVVAAAREHGPERVALEDPTSGTMTYKRLLMGARILGRKLGSLASPGGAIGVMLPSSNGAVVTILGLVSAGRVPAMVNFTAGAGAIKAAGTVAAFDTIVTSRAFVAKARYETLVAELEKSFSLVYLEDLQPRITRWDKLDGLLRHRKALARRCAGDAAAILFTSGSEGAPKGVVLSHRNMLSNAAQAKAVVDFGREDKVFNVLPVFHAFGLTIGLAIPLVHGVPVYLYPSPLHFRIVPELIYITNATILFGTDTFLTGYGRAANPYDLRSLRYVMAGAEPVRAVTRAVWMEKFGLRILEGYGVTETAPVLALNTPMFNRYGSVGRLMPGMEARLEPVEGIEEGGRLQVRGPNVMLGYLKVDEPGSIQPVEGEWYDTGDIVTIDAQSFITIKGRAKRFAKVAGEMISLAAVEVLAGELWPGELSGAVFMPDVRRGEKIVLVTQATNATRADFAAYARDQGAHELLVPAEVVTVPHVPLLGSGKVDLPAVKRLVEEREAQKAAAA